MMTKLTRGVKSNGFREWLQQVEPLVKPTIEALGTAIGHIAVGLGGLIVAFKPFATQVLGGIDGFTKRFSDWAKNLGDGKHTGFNALISEFQQNWPLVKQGLGDFAAILKNVLGDVTGLATGGNSKALWEIANPILGMLKEASSHPDLVRALLYLLAIKDAAGKISPVFSGIQSAATAMSSARTFLGLLFSGKNPFTTTAIPMQTAGDTMAGAAAAMQRAADTMVGADAGAGKGGLIPGLGGKGAGAAEGEAAGGGAGLSGALLPAAAGIGASLGVGALWNKWAGGLTQGTPGTFNRAAVAPVLTKSENTWARTGAMTAGGAATGAVVGSYRSRYRNSRRCRCRRGRRPHRRDHEGPESRTGPHQKSDR